MKVRIGPISPAAAAHISAFAETRSYERSISRQGAFIDQMRSEGMEYRRPEFFETVAQRTARLKAEDEEAEVKAAARRERTAARKAAEDAHYERLYRLQAQHNLPHFGLTTQGMGCGPTEVVGTRHRAVDLRPEDKVLAQRWLRRPVVQIPGTGDMYEPAKTRAATADEIALVRGAYQL